jgi:hypothetical protein
VPAVTLWTRLDVRTRADDADVSLQARVHDPLWLLARQWQFGEFRGEDAGTPIHARLRAEAGQLTRFRARGGRGVDVDLSTVPLEAIVEREPVAGATRWRVRVDGGLHFIRLLGRAGAGRYRAAVTTAYGFDPGSLPDAARDSEGAALAALTAGRVPDADRLAPILARAVATSALPTVLSVQRRDVPAVLGAARSWLAWYRELISEPVAGDDAWDPARLEYSFEVGGRMPSGEVVLAATEYTEGHLDWHSFDVAPGRSMGATAPPQSIVRTVMPAPVKYRGMPAPRFWEFEDARVDFGAIAAAPAELARLLLVEFALVYGNDWYLIPVELPVGSLVSITSLVVTDTFGVRTLVPPTSRAGDAADPWRMFTLSTTDGATRDLLLVPPTLGASLHGGAIEQLRLVRDEGANVCWAIEASVPSAAGGAIDRVQLAARLPRPTIALPAGVDAEETYTVMTSVPEHWIPLVPVAIDGTAGRAVELHPRSLLRPEADGSFTPVEPWGGLVRVGGPPIPEEEVPRQGATIERAFQLARWHGGGTLVWLGRRKSVGRGEASSALRFDVTRPISD